MEYIVERTARPRIDIKNIPKQPGCYIFRNAAREIIYIGKSKSLHDRVGQYFHPIESKKGKYVDMIRELRSVEILLTDTETNALILECQLIKHHKPKYNAQMKRSRVYPYLYIDLMQAYPTLTIIEHTPPPGGRYYGCFYHRDDAFEILALINRIWHIPLCCKESFDGHSKPCLNYHMKRCCAPCAGEVDTETYRLILSEIIKCLDGHFRPTLARLKKEMAAASDALAFELAARLRDDIKGLNHLKVKQQRFYTRFDNRDVYLFFSAFNERCFTVFFIRNGVTLHRVDFPDSRTLETKKLMDFIHENQAGKATLTDGAFLSTCLLAIGACKLFVPVSSRIKDTVALEKLQTAYAEFTSYHRVQGG